MDPVNKRHPDRPGHNSSSPEGDSRAPLLPTSRRGSDDRESETFTCQEALDHIGFGRWQVMLLVQSGMVWFGDAVEMMLLSHIGPAVGWGRSMQEGRVTAGNGR